MAREPKNGTSPAAESQPPGVLTFSIAAVRDSRIDLMNSEHWKYVRTRVEKLRPYQISRGDILVVRGNANPDLLGKCGVVDEYPEGCIYPDILKRVVFADRPDGVTGEYAALVWNHPLVHRQLLKRAKTSNGTLKVNNRDVKQVLVPVPSPKEQADIVAVVGAAENVVRRHVAVEQQLAVVKRGLMQVLLTGQVRVPPGVGRRE